LTTSPVEELERMLYERFNALGFNNAPLSSNADVSLTPDAALGLTPIPALGLNTDTDDTDAGSAF
jgi:hypothetical protein